MSLSVFLTSIFKFIISFLNSTFVSSATGGLIGGYFTFWGVKKTILWTEKQRQRSEEQELKAFYQAIQTELLTMKNRYNSSIGNSLIALPESDGLYFHYSAEEDYFAIFNSNAHLIGRIKNEPLRTCIVRTYVEIKGHLDTFRINSLVYRDLQALLPHQTSGSLSIENFRIASLKKIMVEHARTLKRECISMNGHIDECCELLSKEI